MAKCQNIGPNKLKVVSPRWRKDEVGRVLADNYVTVVLVPFELLNYV